MSFLLPEASVERIEAIKDAAELSTATDVIRQSVRLYEAMMKEAIAGSAFKIIRADGKEEPFHPFFMSNPR